MLHRTVERQPNTSTSNYVDPHRYWEERHQTHQTSLRAPGHRLLGDEQNAEQYELKRTCLTGTISRYVREPVGKSLLDAGCGTGVLASSFVDMGFNVVGVDFSQTAIDAARQNCPAVEFAVSPIPTLCLDRRFDVIVTVDVLLHVVSDVEWRAAIEALCLHLRPGGLFVVFDCLRIPIAADHVRSRALEAYTQELKRHNVALIEHEQLYLPHEQAYKDILVARQHKGML